MFRVVAVFILFIASMSFAVEQKSAVSSKKTEVVQKKVETTAATASKPVSKSKPKVKRKKLDNEPIRIRRMKSFKSQKSVKEKQREKSLKASPK